QKAITKTRQERALHPYLTSRSQSFTTKEASTSVTYLKPQYPCNAEKVNGQYGLLCYSFP
ncbi:hypothetical protein KA005_36290, partial [bacterium]|nr:hypothetical protein [bacterium]